MPLSDLETIMKAQDELMQPLLKEAAALFGDSGRREPRVAGRLEDERKLAKARVERLESERKALVARLDEEIRLARDALTRLEGQIEELKRGGGTAAGRKSASKDETG